MVIVAKTGQPWDQVVRMDAITRKCFCYVHSIQEGYEVNWATGQISRRGTPT